MPALPIDWPAVRAAADLLEVGGLVAFPTETVYGLGADAENPAAVASIYAAKGRPSNHPVIVHLAPGADLDYWAEPIPAAAQALVAAFWPGPLSLIFKRAARIAAAVSGGQDSIALRCPSHPLAQALLRAFRNGQGGIAAPSANKFGRVSPTTAQHVRDEFGPPQPRVGHGVLNAVLDGGASPVGIESTILDVSRLATHGPVLLRPGHISAAQLAAVLGQWPKLPDAGAPRASGTLEAHYAPRTPVARVAPAQLEATMRQLVDAGRRLALIGYGAGRCDLAVAQVVLPATPDGYAQALYAALRQMDAAGADLILLEAPPETEPWRAVNDRLRRAAHDSAGILGKLI
jgi:L-threonylcarbamoyladenylate synthase